MTSYTVAYSGMDWDKHIELKNQLFELDINCVQWTDENFSRQFSENPKLRFVYHRSIMEAEKIACYILYNFILFEYCNLYFKFIKIAIYIEEIVNKSNSLK
jgi:hypothetical protein